VQEKLGVGDGDQVSVTWDLADGEHPKKYAEWADSSKQKLWVRCSSRIQRNIGMDPFKVKKGRRGRQRSRPHFRQGVGQTNHDIDVGASPSTAYLLPFN
jgi:hypothetical protein